MSGEWTYGDLDYWARDRIRQLEQRLSAPRPFEDDLQRLEYNFARALLLLQSLVEVCHQKGVFTREELGAMAAEIDMLDGKTDGALNPGHVPGMKARPTQNTVEGFLHELRRREPPPDTSGFKIRT